MPNYHYQQVRISLAGDAAALDRAQREILRIVDSMEGACLGFCLIEGQKLRASLAIPACAFDDFKRRLAKSGSDLLREVAQPNHERAAA